MMGKTNIEVHISKNVAKVAINCHKIGQMSLLGKNGFHTKVSWNAIKYFLGKYCEN